MKLDPHYNLVKCFLHVTLPPSRNRWWISCVPTLWKCFFPGAALLHIATALESSPTSPQDQSCASPSTRLRAVKDTRCDHPDTIRREWLRSRDRVTAQADKGFG